MLALKYSDINNLDIPGSTSIRICGKGHKERTVPLWESTARYISKYTGSLGISGDNFLLMNKNGHLTRSGIRSRIDILDRQASNKTPTLCEKTISA